MFIFLLNIFFCNTGCSPVKQPEEKAKSETITPITLKLWHQWVQETDSSTNSLKSAVDEWNANNPYVQIQADGINGEQYKTKIKTALAAGEAPDIFYMWGGSFVYPYIKSGNILPLDDYLDDEIKNKLIPGTLEQCIFDGEIYSLPMYTFIASLYCNEELFNKVGVKIPNTYDELLGAVKAFRKKGITPVVIGEKDRWPGMYWFNILAMRQAGSEACLEAMKKPELFGQPEFLEAAVKLEELVKAGAFNDDAFSMGFDEMLREFTQGNAAMIYQGNWVDVHIENSNSKTKGKVKVVPFPVIQDGKGSVSDFLGGNVDGYYININTKYKEEAVEVLKFISEKAGKEGYLNGAGIPCWKAGDIDEAMMPALSRQSAKLMSTGTSFVGWWDTILPASDSEMHKSLVAELIAGKKTPDEFVSEMTKLKGINNFAD